MAKASFSPTRLAFLVSAGNIDSMVNHYYVSKKRRQKDYYTPGGVMGKRPDHATITYSKAIKKVESIIEEYKNTENFGNARFIRNLYEKTIIKTFC